MSDNPQFNKIDFLNGINTSNLMKAISESNYIQQKQQESFDSILNNDVEQFDNIKYSMDDIIEQLKTANETNQKQLVELVKLHNINDKLENTNIELKNSNKHKFRNGILIGLIPSVIILVATVILTYFGLL